MAAIPANNGGNREFLKIKNGKFYFYRDKELTTPYHGFSGYITGLSYRTEDYNGAPIEKLQLSLTDEEKTYVLGISVENNLYSKTVSFLKSLDLSQEVEMTIGAKKSEKDPERLDVTVFFKQNGISAKSFFKKGDLPAWNKVRANGKDIWDREDYLIELKRVVEKELVPNLIEAPTPTATPSTPSQPVVLAPNQEEEADELPF